MAFQVSAINWNRAAEFVATSNLKLPVPVISNTGGRLIYLVAKQCNVSQLAVRVRLAKLGLLVESPTNSGRFHS